MNDLPTGITLRPTCVLEDDAFLFTLYVETHRKEIESFLGWGSGTTVAVLPEPLLRMQFEARRRSYQQRFPELQDWIILDNDRPVGHLLMASTEQEMRLVEIALLPGYCGRGIGTALIRATQNEAAQAGIPACLSVTRDNSAARRLYERLGFAPAANTVGGLYGMYEEMVWRAAAA
jgi:ribosomal protein S18 acetylase RimI-like enzyme